MLDVIACAFSMPAKNVVFVVDSSSSSTDEALVTQIAALCSVVGVQDWSGRKTMCWLDVSASTEKRNPDE